MALSTRLAGDHDNTYSNYYGQNSPLTISTITPSRLLNSVLLSTINTATDVLSSVGSSSSAVTREGGRWKVKDHLRYIFMLALWVTLWGLRLLVDWVPTSFSGNPQSDCYLPGSVASSSSTGSESEERYYSGTSLVSSTKAVGRALSHVLGLLNEIPANSRKYDFALSMAERILDENVVDGHPTLAQINRSSLAAAFSRTSDLLLRSLQGSHASDTVASMWPSRALRLLPVGGPQLASYYDGLCSLWLDFTSSMTTKQQQRGRGGGNYTVPRSECVEAEKFARELLWITNKMNGCSCLDEAILRWSFASGLASLSLTAHQRVQVPIVKISAIVLRELVPLELEAPREVRFRILALWLPLFCYASRGTACPVMTGSEKREMETVLDELIRGLPWEDQEVILTNWLEDFTYTDSDWPDLHRCYDHWCRSCRKLLL